MLDDKAVKIIMAQIKNLQTLYADEKKDQEQTLYGHAYKTGQVDGLETAKLLITAQIKK